MIGITLNHFWPKAKKRIMSASNNQQMRNKIFNLSSLKMNSFFYQLKTCKIISFQSNKICRLGRKWANGSNNKIYNYQHKTITSPGNLQTRDSSIKITENKSKKCSKISTMRDNSKTADTGYKKRKSGKYMNMNLSKNNLSLLDNYLMCNNKDSDSASCKC